MWVERLHDSQWIETMKEKEIKELKDEKKREWIGHYGYQTEIDEMSFPKNEEALEKDHSFLMNHSCHPTVLVYNRQVWIASRDIKEEEEISYDYATSEIIFDRLPSCLCGAPNCRGKVTKDDWKLTSVREAYGDFFQPHLLGLLWKEQNN